MDFDPKRHRLKMVDALRYIGGLSHNTPTRSMLRHLEIRGLVESVSLVVCGVSEFRLTGRGRVFIDQADAYFSGRANARQFQGRGPASQSMQRVARKLAPRVLEASC